MQTSYTNKVLTVSELTSSIKAILENNFTFICLKGEISNLRAQASGHIYFSLKDAYSQISCVIFKGNAKDLKKIPKDGDEVIVEAQMSVYPPRGNYQLIIRKLSYAGVGDLLLKLHELKDKLKSKGYFDKIHKKTLPLFPKKIGVVTSPTGSVIQDILNVLKRRFFNFHLLLNPVKVQGEGSALQIAKAIKEFNQYNLVDVIIIARGGGSLEDLWPFNEEIVAKAIFESKIPIISAVGHETDTSISDYVSDVRAPTPSAAAEIVLKEKNHFLEIIKNFQKQLLKHISYQINNLKIRIDSFQKQPLFSSPYALIGKQMQMLDDLKNAINISIKQKLLSKKDFLNLIKNQLKPLNLQHKIKDQKIELEYFIKQLNMTYKNVLNIKIERLDKLISHLKAIDPKTLLKKGYSILFSEKQASIILSKDELKIDDKFVALVSDGKIYAKVEKKHER